MAVLEAQQAYSLPVPGERRLQVLGHADMALLPVDRVCSSCVVCTLGTVLVGRTVTIGRTTSEQAVDAPGCHTLVVTLVLIPMFVTPL
jgi:hypothetical protein